MKDLSLAIDFFKRLKGEKVNENEGEVEEEEDSLLMKLKGRLKRRRKAPSLVQGSSNGSGEGEIISISRPLPEGAMMVTPFRLEDS